MTDNVSPNSIDTSTIQSLYLHLREHYTKATVRISTPILLQKDALFSTEYDLSVGLLSAVRIS